MAVTIQIPPRLEEQLRREVPNLDESVREQFIITQYQAGHLSLGDIALILDYHTRHEAEQWLGVHGISANYSEESLNADRRTLDDLLRPGKR